MAMKLRNKKTGKVIEALISAYGISGDVAVSVMDSNSESGYTDLGRYKTLAEFNEEWEDAGKLKYNSDENSLDDIYRNTITFNRGLDLEDGHSYTIPELCGEGEE